MDTTFFSMPMHTDIKVQHGPEQVHGPVYVLEEFIKSGDIKSITRGGSIIQKPKSKSCRSYFPKPFLGHGLLSAWIKFLTKRGELW